MVLEFGTNPTPESPPPSLRGKRKISKSRMTVNPSIAKTSSLVLVIMCVNGQDMFYTQFTSFRMVKISVKNIPISDVIHHTYSLLSF